MEEHDENTETKELKKKTDLDGTIALGFLYSTVFAGIICVIVYLLRDYYHSSFIPTTLFFGLPFCMGLICAYTWRNIRVGFGRGMLYSLLNLLISLLLSIFILREGSICLLIVSPVLYVMLVVGFAVGKWVFRKKNKVFRFSVAGLMAVLIVTDLLSPHSYDSMISDELVINAPPQTVWKYIVAYPEITEQPEYWLFKLGMPAPVQSTATDFKLGAARKCIFQTGLIFDEKITSYNPGQELTFDITRMPKDPEILGHLDILKGQFILKDNGNGSTILTGNSWYRLYVFPTWYYDMWARSITSNVHIRVMKHIKLLSETDIKKTAFKAVK